MTNIIVQRERNVAAKLSEIGLTLPEWRILRIIHSYSTAIPMSVVIEHSQSDRTTIGRTVERLVRRGFVERLPDAHDKRAFLVRKCTAVDGVYKKASAIVTEHDSAMLSGFTDAEQELLVSLLGRI